jgi:sulfate permease, SulP family
VLVPKFFTTIQDYHPEQFTRDVIAGVIVGIVALPLAIAFAIASGVSPERGLYTAIVAGFLISALGGSRVQIGGPTGAFVVIVSGIVGQYGVDGLVLATLMAGFIIVAFGLLRWGAAIKFIPYPVTIGFTIIAVWPRVSRRIPGPFVALIATTLAVQLFHIPVETIGARFGEIHAGLPRPTLPMVTLDRMKALAAPAFTIALLASIESLLSAVVADGMIGGRHRSNMELVAQGIANIASPLFGGMPATGAIARTATNVKNGGRTPVAGMTHALTLLLITLFFGRWAALIPLATLAGILVVVAFHMSEWRTFASEFRAPKSDVVVLLTTFLLTVLVDLTVAIEVGMVLAAFLFMRRMAEVTNISVLTHEFADPVDDFEHDPNAVRRRVIPDGVQVYEITGPFFFGAAEMFKDRVGRIAGQPKVLILRMRHVPAVDSTGLHALRELVQRSRQEGSLVILSDVHAQPVVALERSGIYDDLGEENIHGNIDDALNRARQYLGLPPVAPPTGATPTVARESSVTAKA